MEEVIKKYHSSDSELLKFTEDDLSKLDDKSSELLTDIFGSLKSASINEIREKLHIKVGYGLFIQFKNISEWIYFLLSNFVLFLISFS